jgi:Spy/CpxP family protein refolding chaperone
MKYGKWTMGLIAMTATVLLAGAVLAQPKGRGGCTKGAAVKCAGSATKADAAKCGGDGKKADCGKPMLGIMARNLDLTKEQVAKVKVIMDKYRKEGMALRGQLMEKRVALRKLAMADKVDEAAIKKASAELADITIKIAKLHTQARAEIQPLLSKEQIAKMEALREKCQKGSGMVGCGMGKGMRKSSGSKGVCPKGSGAKGSATKCGSAKK